MLRGTDARCPMAHRIYRRVAAVPLRIPSTRATLRRNGASDRAPAKPAALNHHGGCLAAFAPPPCALLDENPPLLLAFMRRPPPIEWEPHEDSKVRSACPRPHADGCTRARHTHAALARARSAQTVTLKVRRVCALPTCSIRGVSYHESSQCSDPHCPETGSVGAHSTLCARCDGKAARDKQPKLWKQSSAHNPSAWWSFPPADALLEGVS